MVAHHPEDRSVDEILVAPDELGERVEIIRSRSSQVEIGPLLLQASFVHRTRRPRASSLRRSL